MICASFDFQMFHMSGFILVLIIVVVAYGIFMHTLLFPQVSVSWQILFKVLFRPYLLVFGELGISSYNREFICFASFIGSATFSPNDLHCTIGEPVLRTFRLIFSKQFSQNIQNSL